ncbi:hypothetical protein KIN20_029223 [Parelaphostrongylus tenuis]|uniref:Uncharacterized protein n=1 Tax=Parelaphostrongylus tenuis TaxID=148309 RepID=A0AAD5WFF9_PARTN|nr:hypothetical protein KIN20_029223 [Parelaphostrongylus tenuis]
MQESLKFLLRYLVSQVDKGRAQALVRRLVMQTVFDVLELQARSALLPDPIISGILSQLSLNISYEPLECQAVAITLMEMSRKWNHRAALSSATLVTGICARDMADKMCSETTMVKITPVSTSHTSISGLFRQQTSSWRIGRDRCGKMLMNKAVRLLASGPFGSQFFTATGTVGGS